MTEYDPSVAAVAPALKGPGNDVALMWRTAREAGIDPDRIRLLTGPGAHLPAAAQAQAVHPTRAAILSGLDDLAADVAEGDDVLIYFAGHGSQLPAAGKGRQGEEPDGLDEVFLPADFRIADRNGTLGFTNELRDDDIGRRIDRMIARGANVWLIADTCHAGTLRRGDPPALVPRQLTLWHGLSRPVADDGGTLVSDRTGAGQFVGFYGARAGALAYETRISATEGGDGRVHGLLTWSLVHAIRSGAGDYRDLARATGSGIWTASGGRGEPSFAGAMGARPMIGGDPVSDRHYPVMAGQGGLHLAAGRLDGLVEGERVAIGRDRGEPLAIARIMRTGLAASELEIAPAGSGETVGLDSELSGAGLDPARHRMRWLEDRAPVLTGWPLEPALPGMRPDAARLLDIAESLSTTGISAALETEISIRPSEGDGCPAIADRETGPVPVVHHCDLVEVKLRNTGTVPADITPFYLSPDGEIYFLSGYSGSNFGGLRLAPREEAAVSYVEDTAPTSDGRPAAVGRVRLLFLAVEADPHNPSPADFRHLRTQGGNKLRSAGTGAPQLVRIDSGAAIVTVETRAPD